MILLYTQNSYLKHLLIALIKLLKGYTNRNFYTFLLLIAFFLFLKYVKNKNLSSRIDQRVLINYCYKGNFLEALLCGLSLNINKHYTYIKSF